MKKLTVMIIDGEAEKKLKIVQIDDTLKAMQEIVGGSIAIGHKIPVRHGEARSYDVYVNDEGLLFNPEIMFQVVTKNNNGELEVSNPLAGRAVIVASNYEGESISIDPNVIIEKGTSAAFITKDKPEQWNSMVDWFEEAYGTSYGLERAEH